MTLDEAKQKILDRAVKQSAEQHVIQFAEFLP